MRTHQKQAMADALLRRYLSTPTSEPVGNSARTPVATPRPELTLDQQLERAQAHIRELEEEVTVLRHGD